MAKFKKGHTPWNKGKKHSLETIEKLRKAKLGKRGINTNRWINGRTVDNQGYIWIYNPSHPFAIHGRYIKEHRLVIEKIIGRYLRPKERIHHIDGNKTNNKIYNLILFKTNGYHLNHHTRNSTKGIIFNGAKFTYSLFFFSI